MNLCKQILAIKIVDENWVEIDGNNLSERDTSQIFAQFEVNKVFVIYGAYFLVDDKCLQ